MATMRTLLNDVVRDCDLSSSTGRLLMDLIGKDRLDTEIVIRGEDDDENAGTFLSISRVEGENGMQWVIAAD
jgi:hypothetical protein